MLQPNGGLKKKARLELLAGKHSNTNCLLLREAT
jgi:hypothetical protein